MVTRRMMKVPGLSYLYRFGRNDLCDYWVDASRRIYTSDKCGMNFCYTPISLDQAIMRCDESLLDCDDFQILMCEGPQLAIVLAPKAKQNERDTTWHVYDDLTDCHDLWWANGCPIQEVRDAIDEHIRHAREKEMEVRRAEAQDVA